MQLKFKFKLMEGEATSELQKMLVDACEISAEGQRLFVFKGEELKTGFEEGFSFESSEEALPSEIVVRFLAAQKEELKINILREQLEGLSVLSNSTEVSINESKFQLSFELGIIKVESN